MTIPLTLINNLCASNADNDIDAIIAAVRVLGAKYDLSLEAQQDIAAAFCDMRLRVIKGTVESCEIALREVLEARR